jgi:hypothetical protein
MHLALENLEISATPCKKVNAYVSVGEKVQGFRVISQYLSGNNWPCLMEGNVLFCGKLINTPRQVSSERRSVLVHFKDSFFVISAFCSRLVRGEIPGLPTRLIT